MSVGFELLKMGFKKRMKYRLDFLLDILLIPFTFLITYFVWTALYEYNAVSTIKDFTLNQTLTYYAISTILIWVTGTNLVQQVGHIITRGEFARYTIFPISFFEYNFLKTVGEKIPGTIIRIPIFFVSFVYFFKISVNTNIFQIILFIISCILSFVLLFTFTYLMSLLSFWEEAYWSLNMLVWAFLGFFSGSLIPLDFYPSFLSFVKYLPFKYINYSPVMIYMGRMSLEQTLMVFFNQIIFIIIFYYLAKIVFNKGRSKFTSQGG